MCAFTGILVFFHNLSARACVRLWGRQGDGYGRGAQSAETHTACSLSGLCARGTARGRGARARHRRPSGAAPALRGSGSVRPPSGSPRTLHMVGFLLPHKCTTTGAWASRKHKLLVANNRKALARLRAGGTTVHFRHARAHTGHAMNERADALALSGAQGMRSRDGRAYTPATGSRALPADTVPD